MLEIATNRTVAIHLLHYCTTKSFVANIHWPAILAEGYESTAYGIIFLSFAVRVYSCAACRYVGDHCAYMKLISSISVLLI